MDYKTQAISFFGLLALGFGVVVSNCVEFDYFGWALIVVGASLVSRAMAKR